MSESQELWTAIQQIEKAIYGDSKMGAARRGIAHTVNDLQSEVAAVSAQTRRINATLEELAPLVKSTADKTTIVYQHNVHSRRNNISHFFAQVTLVLTIMLLTFPITVEEVRILISQQLTSIHAFLILAATTTVSAIVSLLTRTQ